MSCLTVRAIDCSPRKHTDQMRAIFRAAVQVAVEAVGGNAQPLMRFRCEAFFQSVFERRQAKHAVGPGARNGDTHIRRPPGNEHARRA